MNEAVVEAVRRHCRAMVPRPTSTPMRLTRLPRIEAVLFDIYGTMLISGAGDITLQTDVSSDEAFRDALAACGLANDVLADSGAALLQETIAEHQAAGRRKKIDYPEVNIVDVWQDTIVKLARPGPIAAARPAIDLQRLAAEYEVRVNPVWPMPGLVSCLQAIRSQGLLLGIVSNAQSMTADIFPALLERSLADLGFSPDLQFFSYRVGESKPGRAMFKAAAAALHGHGIAPDGAVYIGNDVLNDIWAAQQVGFRTILFAGDERSLRLRADDECVRECSPDAIVKTLASIKDCLGT